MGSSPAKEGLPILFPSSGVKGLAQNLELKWFQTQPQVQCTVGHLVAPEPWLRVVTKCTVVPSPPCTVA